MISEELALRYGIVIISFTLVTMFYIGNRVNERLKKKRKKK